jgi:hypothetical protein
MESRGSCSMEVKESCSMDGRGSCSMEGIKGRRWAMAKMILSMYVALCSSSCEEMQIFLGLGAMHQPNPSEEAWTGGVPLASQGKGFYPQDVYCKRLIYLLIWYGNRVDELCGGRWVW